LLPTSVNAETAQLRRHALSAHSSSPRCNSSAGIRRRR
jgi:hypothetical protein